MTLSSAQKKWAIPVVLILLLIILNPSYSDFKDFTGHQKDNPYYILQREYNFLLFSIYSTRDLDNGTESHRYFSILKNFILLS